MCDNTPNTSRINQIYGCALGAAVGDALGMPLEFGPKISPDAILYEMMDGPLPAGSFTDDTEMALALCDSLIAWKGFNPTDVMQEFYQWFSSKPRDIGVQTSAVLNQYGRTGDIKLPAKEILRGNPESAGNGSVMRCWPIAVVFWNSFEDLIRVSRQQSELTHLHQDCLDGCAFINAIIYYLLHGKSPEQAVRLSLQTVQVTDTLKTCILQAPTIDRSELINSGWVIHTIQSAVWGLLRFNTFRDSVAQVASLGNDADTAASVTGALAGAAYGVDNIPLSWLEHLRGEWPLNTGIILKSVDLKNMVNKLLRINNQ